MGKKASKTRIAAATMSAGSNASIGPGLTGKMIEDAMSKATLDALAGGVTDPQKILKLKLAARDKLVAEHRKKEAAAAKAASRGK
jgi:hypothetical protein